MAAACASGVSGDLPPPPTGVGPSTLRVLQLNLCDSGIAGCFTGRSVDQAAAVIRAVRPEVVTLNEVCRGDVWVLSRELSGSGRGGAVIPAFETVVQPGAGDGPVRCRNGQPYGIGVLVRVDAPYRGYATAGGRYPIQDAADSEKRAWLCVHAIAHVYACTTHLASTSGAVALRQCRYLMDTAIPKLRPDNLHAARLRAHGRRYAGHRGERPTHGAPQIDRRYARHHRPPGSASRSRRRRPRMSTDT
jgi:hypothetical protein